MPRREPFLSVHRHGLAWGHRTHKGWCRRVCSLPQYFCRNFSALSTASMDSGWLATARFTTCQQQESNKLCQRQHRLRAGTAWWGTLAQLQSQ